jgi:hypothetical protein
MRSSANHVFVHGGHQSTQNKLVLSVPAGVVRVGNRNNKITGVISDELGRGLDGAIDIIEELMPMEHRCSLGTPEKKLSQDRRMVTALLMDGLERLGDNETMALVGVETTVGDVTIW